MREFISGCDRPSSGRNDVHVSHLRCDSDLPASFNRHFPASKCIGYRRDGPRLGSAVAHLLRTFHHFDYPCRLLQAHVCDPSDAPDPELRCVFLPYLLQVSAAHSSVRLGQHFFGETTPRPLAHAAPEWPRKSFWGYVGHWCPSSGCCHLLFASHVLHSLSQPSDTASCLS